MISYTAYFLCFSYKPEKKNLFFPFVFEVGIIMQLYID